MICIKEETRRTAPFNHVSYDCIILLSEKKEEQTFFMFYKSTYFRNNCDVVLCKRIFAIDNTRDAESQCDCKSGSGNHADRR